MRNYPKLFLFVLLLFALFGFLLPNNVFAHAENKVGRQQGQPTADELINAVNALRLAYGMVPLNPHPVLMQVAQEEVNGIASGAGGHWRPDNVTLGQWLIMLGYPLSGDLSLDGYRSENWVVASTVDEAISAWLGDDPHTNTMLSPNRSDIGAAVAVGDQTYFVIETALQTRSGQQQSDAYDILTGIPMTQAVYSNGAPLSDAEGLIPEYIIPVMRSTARPDGDVYHKVQNGQTLWSIAVTYGTTIKRLAALNNLGDSTIVHPDQMLLVQKGATQPAPVTATFTISPVVTSTLVLDSSASPTSVLPTKQAPLLAENQGPSFGSVMGVLIFVVVIVVIIAAWLIREPV